MKFDLPSTDEPIGFKANELVVCARCHRQNGPDRAECLYCGEALPATERNANKDSPPLRKLEAWEPAFNLIVVSKTGSSDADMSSVASLTGADKRVLDSILNSPLPLPLARIETKDLADDRTGKLSDLGLAAAVVADKDLDSDHPPVRLRNLDFGADQLVLTEFNSEKVTHMSLADVCLIVTGRIVETRRDEVTTRRKGKTKVLDEAEVGTELRLIDLYSSNDTIGYRILTTGFDFSVLGDEKEMLANVNIGKLTELLGRRCPNSVIANQYDSVRDQLDAVWEPESRKDSQGLQLRSVGKHEFGVTYTSSNLSQFTKYSRMRRLLI